MNAQVTKLMNVISTPCVTTLKGRIAVAVKVDILEMETIVPAS